MILLDKGWPDRSDAAGWCGNQLMAKYCWVFCSHSFA